ncbi:MAG: ferrous iron transport protein B [Clostridia bacterium]|nr:ferrous iron transport protein B [Clostridia bacterium]
MSDKIFTLGDLRIGQGGYIKTVDGDNALRRRIVDMGITPGTYVRIIKTAPMGDPLEITLRGYTLSLRREDAKSIQLLSDDDAKAFRAEMVTLQRELELEANKALSHGPDEDSEHHRRAAMITEFIMAKQHCTGDCKRCKESIHSGDDNDGIVRIALVGNPNSGKTTLFNAMTGSREYVGNWPGVTVEKKEGRIKNTALCTHNHDMVLVDLPGIYSLSPYSMEEMVARRYITGEKPEAIINIVDGTNLERNLYLTVQLMELERPMIIALNMMDEVEKRGDEIDVKKLSLELGVPVVPISARSGIGIDELISNLQRLIHAAHAQYHEGFNIEPDDIYNGYTHAIHHRIGDLVDEYAEKAGLPLHWAEMKLMEGDKEIRRELNLPSDIQRQVDSVLEEYAASLPLGDSESMIADARYRYVTRVAAASLKRGQPIGEPTFSDKIDRVLTHRIWALPIFIGIMICIFALTFGSIGAWLSDMVSLFMDEAFSPFVRSAMEGAGAMDWLISLVCDGIITGVGGVLTFLPQIAILFFFLSILEDSGYMSRIAFIMDKPMRRFGLSGKSFIPLLMGFGCTVPAAMGARTMENDKDKRMTILLLPFMSCSAKLPVYGLIAGAFFAKGRMTVIMSLYVLGIAVGILSGYLFRRTLFTDNDASFMIELPAYRLPAAKNVFTHVWERVSHFIEKAGTIIFAMSVVLWFLQSFDLSFAMTDSPEHSILGVIGGAIAPIFTPMGFGSWQAAVALLTGLVAKEVVVSSLAMFCGFSLSAGGGAVQGALSGIFTARSAYAFLVFVLLYTPCMAAVATIRRELNSRKLTAFAVCYQLVIAYAASLAVYLLSGLFF